MYKNNAIYKELWMIAPLFMWLDRHPVISNIMLWIEGLLLAYVVFTYNFTTYI